jgi:hypothetical protein
MGNSVDASGGVIEDLADGAPLRAVANLREWSRSSQIPIWLLAARLLRECGLRRMLTANEIDRTIARHGGSPAGDRLDAASDLFLLTRRGAEQWMENIITLADATLERANPAKRDLVRGVLSTARNRTLASASEFGRVHRSYPYMHRPLVELVLGIPLGRLCRPGEPRALMREAFAPILPGRILARRSKGYIAPFHHRTIQSSIPNLHARLESLYLVRAGIIDPNRLRARINAFRHGAVRQTGNLLPIVSFERWAAACQSQMCAH